MDQNRTMRRKRAQLFGCMIYQSIHVLRIEPACNDVERAFGFGYWRTRRCRFRHRLFRSAIGNPQSQQMPEFRLFCLEIFFVVRIGFGPDRHLLDHFQTVALQADNFLRIICQEAELSHAQIEKNLCAEPVIPQIGPLRK